jgi:GT2 family glycosyltransferase
MNIAPRPTRDGRTLAVLMASHNRRDTTLACLRSVASQVGANVTLRVYLVDDASTDGTASAVRAEFPEVAVLDGSGDLFWSGGMRVAQEAASDAEPDFLLWLNDDVVLASGAVTTLLTTHEDLRARRLLSERCVTPRRERPLTLVYDGTTRCDECALRLWSLSRPRFRLRRCTATSCSFQEPPTNESVPLTQGSPTP